MNGSAIVLGLLDLSAPMNQLCEGEEEEEEPIVRGLSSQSRSSTTEKESVEKESPAFAGTTSSYHIYPSVR
jgi:hypothetical protein